MRKRMRNPIDGLSRAEALGKLRVLDLTKEEVRKAIAEAKNATSLFSGTLARDYS